MNRLSGRRTIRDITLPIVVDSPAAWFFNSALQIGLYAAQALAGHDKRAHGNQGAGRRIIDGLEFTETHSVSTILPVLGDTDELQVPHVLLTASDGLVIGENIGLHAVLVDINPVQLLFLHFVRKLIDGVRDNEVLIVFVDHAINQFPVAEQQLFHHPEPLLVTKARHVVAA